MMAPVPFWMTGQTPVATATAAVAAALYQHQMQALQLCRQRLDASTSSSSALTNWNSAPEANLRKGKALFRPAVCLSVKVCPCLSTRLSVYGDDEEHDDDDDGDDNEDDDDYDDHHHHCHAY